MPRLVQTRWNGHLHHSLEYGPRPGMSVRLGTVQGEPVNLTDQEAAVGLDALVRLYFPDAAPTAEVPYHGA